MVGGSAAVRRGLAMTALVAVTVLPAACSGAGASPSPGADGSADRSADGASTPAAVTAQTPVVASVLYPPVPFEGSDGRTHLVYELQVTNFTPGRATIERLDVLDAASGERVLRMGRAAVAGRLQPVGLREGARQLTASQAATLFLHVTVASADDVPAALEHELTVTAEVVPPDLNPITASVAPVTVDERRLPVLGPPLSGEGIIAADACCDAVRHTRAILAINGQPYVAQRYAVDYEKVDAQGRVYVGERVDPSSYTIYGDQAVAAAEGTVVGAMNDLPEQTPGTFPENIPLDEADGNFVVIDLGDGFFANYAHLQPGSVRVEPGDRVERGDVLGLIGNSGNSVAPHLHFHVMDGPSPLAAQGLPYLIDAFTVTAQSASTEAFDTAEADGTPLQTVPSADAGSHTDQLVLDQRIVTYQPAG
jgi:murein DD-endopeptidase MepM/ murein hydrolase activator NlpD